MGNDEKLLFYLACTGIILNSANLIIVYILSNSAVTVIRDCYIREY